MAKQSSIVNRRSSIAKVGGEPVGEFLLIPFGAVEVDNAVAGKSFTFTRRHAQTAAKWFEVSGCKLAIDYDHQMVPALNTRPDGLSPAAGWIGRMEVRGDGLWVCDVEWTDKARSLLASGEYRYFSPVIYWTDEQYSEVDSLGPVALSNVPAMRGVPALAAGKAGERAEHVMVLAGREVDRQGAKSAKDARKGSVPVNRQSSIINRQSQLRRRDGQRGRSAHLLAALEIGVTGMEQLLQILGLPGEASVEDVLAAVTDENRAGVAEALGLPAEATFEEIEAAIKELFAKSGGGDGDGDGGGAKAAGEVAAKRVVATVAKELQLGEVVSLAALVSLLKAKTAGAASHGTQLQALLKRVGELETENAEHAWERFLVGAAAGKVTPAMTETVKSIFMRDRGEAEQLVKGLPVLASTRSTFAGDKTTGGTLGAADNEAGWKKEYEANRPNEHGVTLQEEFDSVETFVAFKKHQKAGHVTILGARK